MTNVKLLYVNKPYYDVKQRDEVIRKLQHIYDVCNNYWHWLPPGTSKSDKAEAWFAKCTTFELYQVVFAKNQSLTQEGINYLNELFAQNSTKESNINSKLNSKTIAPSCLYCKHLDFNRFLMNVPRKYKVTKDRSHLNESNALTHAKCKLPCDVLRYPTFVTIMRGDDSVSYNYATCARGKLFEPYVQEPPVKWYQQYMKIQFILQHIGTKLLHFFNRLFHER